MGRWAVKGCCWVGQQARGSMGWGVWVGSRGHTLAVVAVGAGVTAVPIIALVPVPVIAVTVSTKD